MDSNEFFTIEIPKGMVEQNDMNVAASLQYGYPEDTTLAEGEKQPLEYLLVMLETKEEIANFGLDIEFDVENYAEVSLASLESSFESFDIINKDVEVQKRDGLSYILYDIEAHIQHISIFYKLAIFEGDHAFYQVITWCELPFKEKFNKEMDQIIGSFKEKK